jgi:ABC-type lipoprotein export system ATPase subunit
MKLISLKGRNVGLLRGDFEFEFDDSLTVITGPIGSGKSTLLTMIRASLTNSFPGGVSSWVSWGIESGDLSYFVASWRIGSKVMHIAKCLAGDRRFAGLGIPRLRIEHDSGQVEDIEGSKEALDRAQSMIPLPASVIDGHLVVDQDSITAPVSSTPAKFKETLHVLTRASEMEQVRCGVRDLMSTVTVPDVEGPLAEAVQEHNTLLGEEAARRGELDRALEALKALDIDVIKARLDQMQRDQIQEQRRKDLASRIREETARHAQLQTRFENEVSSLASYRAKEEATREEAEEAKRSLYSADLLLQANERRSRLLAKAASSQAELDGLLAAEPVAPAKERPSKDDEQQCVDSLSDIRLLEADLARKVALAAKGQCSECGQSTALPGDQLQGMSDQLAASRALKAEETARLTDIRVLAEAWRLHDSALAAYSSKAAKALEEANRIQAELDEVGVPAPMTPQIKTQLAERARLHDMLLRSISAAESGISSLKNHLTDSETVQADLQDKLDDIPDVRFDPHEHARLLKARQDSDAVAADGIRLKGVLQQLKSSVERAEAKLLAQRQRKEAVEPTIRFRQVLGLASSALAKDALPRILSMQYIQALNERLDFYLQTVRADFTAYIDESLEFMARKNDGLVHSAKRLSGGQKQQASVCYLLAVNDVFASTLGVLALDEPSGAMQESNSSDLAEAFSYLARLGQASGRQFIVITHSPALAAHGCRHIELEGS